MYRRNHHIYHQDSMKCKYIIQSYIHFGYRKSVHHYKVGLNALVTTIINITNSWHLLRIYNIYFNTCTLTPWINSTEALLCLCKRRFCSNAIVRAVLHVIFINIYLLSWFNINRLTNEDFLNSFSKNLSCLKNASWSQKKLPQLDEEPFTTLS